jgi:iron-sulfur cluster assembly protein
MFTVTKAAAEQIRKSARESNLEGMALRVAATRKSDGSFDYGMGFDDVNEEDIQFSSEGVKLVMSPAYVELLNETTMDFVEIEPGQHSFIFINPKDPNYSPPKE